MKNGTPYSPARLVVALGLTLLIASRISSVRAAPAGPTPTPPPTCPACFTLVGDGKTSPFACQIAKPACPKGMTWFDEPNAVGCRATLAPSTSSQSTGQPKKCPPGLHDCGDGVCVRMCM